MKRALLLLLSVALIGGLLPGAAFAEPSSEGEQSENIGTPDNAASSGEILVVFEDQGVGAAGLRAFSEESPEEVLESADLNVVETVVEESEDLGTILMVEVPEGANEAEMIEEVSALPGVAYAQPNYLYTLPEGEDDVQEEGGYAAEEGAEIAPLAVTVNDPYATLTPQSHLTYPFNQYNQYYLYPKSSIGGGVNLVEAWDLFTPKDEVTIAVLDTGCQVGHEDLSSVDAGGNILTAYQWDAFNNTAQGVIQSENVTSGDNSGHGTHVVGIAGATTNNSLGFAGSSYNAAKILPIKVFNNFPNYPNVGGKLTAATADLIKAYEYLFDLVRKGEVDDLRVINMSLGGAQFPNTVFEAAIDKAKDVYNIVTVCAGGNVNQTITTYPSDYEACVAVTNLDKNGNNVLASDYNEHKDISAPGSLIYSTVNNGGYGLKSGTSMASPLVSGILALLWAHDPDLTVDQVKEAIYNTAVEINDPTNDRRTTSGSHGHIDAALAVQYVIDHFSDSKVSINDCTIAAIPDQAYTGNAITPVLSVSYGGSDLVLGTDYTVEWMDNVEIGTATVLIKGIGGYDGQLVRSFAITKIPLSSATVTGVGSAYTYSAENITPDPVVEVQGITLTKDTDYAVAYSDNKNVGTATVTIVGTGAYGGTITRNFTITKADIAQAQVLEIGSCLYTGSAIEPKPQVKFNGIALTENTDYTLSYSDNVFVGTNAKVTITGITNFNGSVVKNFTITVKSISGAVITGVNEQYTFTGGAIKPVPTVKLEGVELTAGTDYRVDYRKNVSVGTATLAVVGIGQYAGSIEKTFRIAAASISGATIGALPTPTYTGAAHTPEPTVTLGGDTLIKGTDFEFSYASNVNAGTASVTVNGKGNYTGSVVKNFTIAKASMSSVTVSGVPHSYIYLGKNITPDPTVKLGTVTLVKGTDYSVGYANNKNVGQATITLAGMGKNYKGSTTAGFTIVKASISGATVTGVNARYSYTGKAITPVPVVKVGSVILTRGVDYVVSYSANTAVGTATITVEGRGNYSGTKKLTFVISKQADDPGSSITFKRLAGTDRYKTMAAILQAGFGKGSAKTVIVATGENYPDALAASSLAGLYNAPIVLTPKASLVAEAKSEITRLGASKAIIIGSTSAVSSSVESSLKKMGLNTERVMGSNRVETAVKIYEKGKKAQGGWGDTAIIASSQGFADALSISSYAYAKKYPIFLADGAKNLSSDVTSALKAGGFKKIIIVGSDAAVSSKVEGQLAKIGVSASNIKRLGGTDRFSTSLQIAKYALANGMKADQLAVATGTNFPDALAGAALCGKNRSVILLVADNDTVKGYLKTFFEANKKNMSKGYALGSPAVVSDPLLSYIKSCCK